MTVGTGEKTTPTAPRIGAVILAAGKGTRLKTELPKVLHEVCGRPMLAYVIDACRAAGVKECVVVVGYQKDLVIRAFADDRDLTWVEQNPQLGTGHAVMVCREHLAGRFDHLFVLAGDGPLIRAETLRTLIERHLAEQAAVTLATAVLDDPTGYGRIWRDPEGRLLGIVEHGDATPEQKQIREVNPSYYCFKQPELLAALDQVRPNNVKNEYYITDAISILLSGGHKVQALTSVPPQDIFSINSRQELAMVNAVMRDRILDRLMSSGVTIVDPRTTWIDDRATIGQDTVIHPNVVISGPAVIGRGCRIGPFVNLTGAARVPDHGVISPFGGGVA
ncbi:MAG: NTP transferase domain-containing protein [Phycisphaerae bacterium]|nr:NTP transferase domain-containing protein [Phycisphaerae bacterium]